MRKTMFFECCATNPRKCAAKKLSRLFFIICSVFCSIRLKMWWRCKKGAIFGRSFISASWNLPLIIFFFIRISKINWWSCYRHIYKFFISIIQQAMNIFICKTNNITCNKFFFDIICK